MAGEAQSAVALRCLIRETASSSPGTGEDMQNINTRNLPDGAQCFVTSTRRLYRFRKFATIAAVENVVIVPSSGGGRWVLEGPTAGAAPLFIAATDENGTDASASANWLAPNTSAFAQQAGAGLWTLTPLGCLLTYHGPEASYFVRLFATVTFPSPNTVNCVVDHNGDITGADAGFAEGEEFLESELADSTQSYIVSSERLVTIAPGETMQPKFRFSGGSDLIIERLTLAANPA